VPLSRCRLYRVIVLSRSLIYKFHRGVEKGARLSKCKLRRPPTENRFSTSRRELPSDSKRMDACIGHDHVDIARNDFLYPLLEKPFVSAYGFTALWFYHLNSASSDLFYHSPLALSPSLSHPIYLSPSSLFPLASLLALVLSHETLRNYCPMKLDVIHVPDVHDSFTARITSNAAP